MTRFVVSTLLAGLIVLVSSSAALAQTPAYGDREARQRPWLDAVRGELNLGYDFSQATESAIEAQLSAIAAELAWRKRGEQTPYVSIDDLDDHLRTAIETLTVMLDRKCPGKPCYYNFVLLRRAVFVASYVMAKYEDMGAAPERTDTADAARTLFKHPQLEYPHLVGIGNVTIANAGMHILAGVALPDDKLLARGRSEFNYMYDENVRKGIGELLSSHYTGLTLAEMALVVDALDEDCGTTSCSADYEHTQEITDEALDLLLLTVGHHYLPGGGVGAPQDRTSGGALTDKDPTRSDHLIQTVNTIVWDPELDGTSVTYVDRLAGIEYEPKTLVRSIFLDKGNGYSFWRRASSMRRDLNEPSGFPAPADYAVGIDGYYYDYFDDEWVDDRLPVVPVQGFVLPGGHATTGIRYATSFIKGLSSATYLRDPIIEPPGTPLPQASDADLGFAILVHRQPKSLSPDDLQNPFQYSTLLADDPLFEYERRSPYRRMMLGGTTLTLFDTSEGTPAPSFELTQVHLPVPATNGTSWGESTAMDCDGNGSGVGWSVIGIEDQAWLGFHPISEAHTTPVYKYGPHDPPQNNDEQGADWEYVELSSPTTKITGDATVIEPYGAHASASSFCTDLAGRNLTVDLAAGTVAIDAVDPDSGDVVTMSLDHPNDLRKIDYPNDGQGPIPQADETFIDHGLLASRWLDSSGTSYDSDTFVTWDDTTFTLTLQRGDDPSYLDGNQDPTVLTLDLGPTNGSDDDPTSPGILEPRWEQTKPSQTGIRINGQAWDDDAVSSYEVWLGEPDAQGSPLAILTTPGYQVWAHVHNDPQLSRCAIQTQNPEVPEVLYTIVAVDNQSNKSPTPARIYVPEDFQPPLDGSNLSLSGTNADVDLSWDAASDECGIYGYQVLRAVEPAAGQEPVFSALGVTNQTSFTDTTICLDPNIGYIYEVRALDKAPNFSAGLQTSPTSITTSTAAPTGLETFTNGGNVVVWWNGPSFPSCLDYVVTFKDNGGNTVHQVTTGATYYQHTLTSGTYTVEVIRDYDWGVTTEAAVSGQIVVP